MWVAAVIEAGRVLAAEMLDVLTGVPVTCRTCATDGPPVLTTPPETEKFVIFRPCEMNVAFRAGSTLTFVTFTPTKLRVGTKT